MSKSALKSVIGIAGALIFSLGAAPGPAAGQEIGVPGEGLRVGRLAFHPTLGLEGAYGSNIYLQEEGPVGDFILRLSPGVKAELPWRENEFRGSYRADLYRHRRYRDQDRDHHRADASADFWFSDFGLRLDNLFLRTSSLWETEFDRRLFRNDNTATITAIGFFNRVQIEGGYRNFFRRFSEPDFRAADRMEHQGLLTGSYRFSPRTRALLQYTYDLIEYRRERSRDGHFHELQAGLRGSLGPRLVGVARLGWQERQYKNPGLNDYHGLVGFASLEHDLSDNTDLEFGWERTPRESIYAGNSFYLINRAWLHWNQRLARKLWAKTGVVYYHHRYPSAVESEGVDRRRRDVTWQAGCRIRYQLQTWLETSVGYAYRDRDSNIPGLSYADHRIEIGLSAFY